jgi:hypothetical protein
VVLEFEQALEVTVRLAQKLQARKLAPEEIDKVCGEGPGLL